MLPAREQRPLNQPYIYIYSYLSASIGFSVAALFAG
jgi:hypothetical protein